MINKGDKTMIIYTNSELNEEEKIAYDAILSLDKASVMRLIETLSRQFDSKELDTADDEEVKVEEKRTYKISISQVGEGTTVPLVRILQGLFPGRPLIELKSMCVVGEINKEFLNKEEAEAVLAKFAAIGKGLEAKLV